MKLYGIREIAEAIDADPRKVSVWYQRGKLPEPTQRLHCGPVWTARRIEPWITRQKPPS